MRPKIRKVVKYGSYAAAIGAGIYIGHRVADPATMIKVFDQSNDLWLRITPEAISRLKDGKNAVIFENTRAGSLMVMKLVNEHKTLSDLGVNVIDRAIPGKELAQAIAA